MNETQMCHLMSSETYQTWRDHSLQENKRWQGEVACLIKRRLKTMFSYWIDEHKWYIWLKISPSTKLRTFAIGCYTYNNSNFYVYLYRHQPFVNPNPTNSIAFFQEKKEVIVFGDVNAHTFSRIQEGIHMYDYYSIDEKYYHYKKLVLQMCNYTLMLIGNYVYL